LEGEEDLIDEEVTAVVLALIVVAGVFTFSQAFLAGRVVEPFSELGVLGAEMKIGDYPREVLVNESFKLHLYIGNHEGRIMYYTIYIKLGDKSTLVNETIPANTSTIAFYEAILPHNETVIIPVNIRINTPGRNLRLIFEMWIHDGGLLKYHGRWCQLWLNVTAPQKP